MSLPHLSIGETPQWSFDPGTDLSPSEGKFQMNNANPSLATQIAFHKQALSGLDMSGFLCGPTPQFAILLTDQWGKSYAFKSTSQGASLDPSVYFLEVTALAADSASFEGDYHFCFQPQTLDTPKLGNVLAASSITPIADGVYNGIQFVGGIAVGVA